MIREWFDGEYLTYVADAFSPDGVRQYTTRWADEADRGRALDDLRQSVEADGWAWESMRADWPMPSGVRVK